VQLDHLLWVRCQNVDQSLRATDLLIQSGGFGIVAVDLSEVSARLARQVPLHVWFRFRRAVEDTSTILLVMEQESNAKTCASLVLRLEAGPTQWLQTGESQCSEIAAPPHAHLWQGFKIRTEVVRSRIPVDESVDSENGSKADKARLVPLARPLVAVQRWQHG
jgi:hypothetical protein